MRATIIAGNWKLNCTLDEAERLARGVMDAALDAPHRQVVLFPPFTALERVGKVARLGPANLFVGGQDLYWAENGAYTGEVSAAQLVDCGCRHVLVGHSERRHLFGETDEATGKKVTAAVEAGLVAVVCVGETLAERQAGQTKAVVERQLTAALGSCKPERRAQIVIAYEPVWAIGTGETATKEQAQEVHAAIRAWMAGHCDADTANRVPILYGGSVNATNAAELLATRDVDGVLVGGASLDAATFARIITAGRLG
ncbi:MAG: triose-phosphate isomerase [Nitrospirae bacterium CG18_big_fil_WC_8_21_14_2_50_70_55]|nr:triose-phosphate isomerase [Deltaproteobacteria bacterium]OIP62901.1 MAG: triose-phosphate isomerase [Nitrospirae bacterium CG2_30_70_394]PIQ05796.1 MAG: triose-phosphate isomerase [Nitrospirae bacterium CG18_big_fil_WC_8_21_14_2_50_70_55]PIU78615.1 MAG: triose-phosphate isomerase [Nitrospirae bacterium CG06_land_8_20_14_3_00_70_43]PIW82475.1 MAG: triose-phosphate isomerase [Nitrospirae bacterium CG_4_8_14_3_um_filter_70_85]PIX82437.1 MAG: triose-phosphate isomerase [Nitrospirae bacterium C